MRSPLFSVRNVVAGVRHVWSGRTVLIVFLILLSGLVRVAVDEVIGSISVGSATDSFGDIGTGADEPDVRVNVAGRIMAITYIIDIILWWCI